MRRTAKKKDETADYPRERPQRNLSEGRSMNSPDHLKRVDSCTPKPYPRTMKDFWNENNLLGEDIPYPLTNDYLARVLLQKRESVLRSILCAALGIQPEEIRSITVTNPIVPGEAINEKEFVMDVKVILNGDISVDLEIQVINYNDWPERSLQYLCRSFDTLSKGEKYGDSRKAIHIGILDFELFKDCSQYYSSYRLMEIETHRVYTEKFQLYTLCLPLLDHATDTDRQFHRDMWGNFFKAKKWKELYDMAAIYPEIEDAAEEIYGCLADRRIREKIEARQDYERRQRMTQEKLSDLQEENRKKDERLAEQSKQIAEQSEQIAEQSEQIAEQSEQIAEQSKQIAELKRLLEQISNKSDN